MLSSFQCNRYHYDCKGKEREKEGKKAGMMKGRKEGGKERRKKERCVHTSIISLILYYYRGRHNGTILCVNGICISQLKNIQNKQNGITS
jgi:hypothetical protein